MSFYIKCVKQAPGAFITAPGEENAALRVGELPLDRFRIEFYNESEIIIRESNQSGKYWSLDPTKNTIILGSKPDPFRFRQVVPNSAEFVLSSITGGTATISSNSELVIKNGGQSRFALCCPAGMDIVSEFPKPSTIDLLSDLADETHRSMAKKCSCQIRELEGSNSPKPILMRRTMPMSSANKIEFFSRLSNMLRVLPVSSKLQISMVNEGSSAVMRLLLHSSLRLQHINSSTETESSNIPFAITLPQEVEDFEERFITDEQIIIRKQPGWHNSDIIAKIDEAIKLDMAEPYLKIPPAVLDIFQQRTWNRLRAATASD